MKASTVLLGALLFCLLAIALFFLIQRARMYERWAVYYHGNLPYEEFVGYDVLAFDGDIFPDFAGKKPEKQIIMGYLSISEAEEYRSYFHNIKAMGVLLEPSDQWQARHAIDIRSQAWREYVVHTLVPRILSKGFDGIMLDTVDTALHLESIDPQRFTGMKAAAIALIKSIRNHHPAAKLMLNRGFAILPDVAHEIDYALAESIRIRYEPATHKASYFPQSVYNELVAVLKRAQRQNPQLKVMTLDYMPAEKASIDMVKHVYAEQRRNGFIPYVTTYDLGNRHEEPL